MNFRFTGDERIPGTLKVDTVAIGVGDKPVEAILHLHSTTTPAIRFTRDSEPNDMFDILQLGNGTGRILI